MDTDNYKPALQHMLAICICLAVSYYFETGVTTTIEYFLAAFCIDLSFKSIFLPSLSSLVKNSK